MTAWNSKKVESTNSRLHGICVVVSQPKDTDAHGKRFPCTERLTSARGSLPKQFSSRRTNKSSPHHRRPVAKATGSTAIRRDQRKHESRPPQKSALSFSIRMCHHARHHNAHDYAKRIHDRLPGRLQELWETMSLNNVQTSS
jgi:hypothetical protein